MGSHTYTHRHNPECTHTHPHKLLVTALKALHCLRQAKSAFPGIGRSDFVRHDVSTVPAGSLSGFLDEVEGKTLVHTGAEVGERLLDACAHRRVNRRVMSSTEMLRRRLISVKNKELQIPECSQHAAAWTDVCVCFIFLKQECSQHAAAWTDVCACRQAIQVHSWAHSHRCDQRQVRRDMFSSEAGVDTDVDTGMVSSAGVLVARFGRCGGTCFPQKQVRRDMFSSEAGVDTCAEGHAFLRSRCGHMYGLIGRCAGSMPRHRQVRASKNTRTC
eukprot:1159466-Pelagomonas_calceolata.AAC.9